MTFNQPIPDYSTRDVSLLESALGQPSQSFGGKLLYPNLVDQASILFYSLIKNHPFQNGNKRIAVMALLVFLANNDKWLIISAADLYELAYLVSESNPTDHDHVLSHITLTISDHLSDFVSN
ncbi:MAG: type II toxin-antitoxin system death-on-curing family toxin [Patescibacteria group bacterium]|jgi:death-on-curing family protein